MKPEHLPPSIMLILPARCPKCSRELEYETWHNPSDSIHLDCPACGYSRSAAKPTATPHPLAPHAYFTRRLSHLATPSLASPANCPKCDKPLHYALRKPAVLRVTWTCPHCTASGSVDVPRSKPTRP